MRVLLETFCNCPDANEAEIGEKGGLEAILSAASHGDLELKGQAARALRNLSVRGEFHIFPRIVCCEG